MSEPVPPESAVPPVDPKPKQAFLTLWFDAKGDLQVKAEGLDIYQIVGVLRAATLKFDDNLRGARPSAPKKEG